MAPKNDLNYIIRIIIRKTKKIIIFTVLLGLRNTSPIPPPFLKPLFKVVIIHIIKVSHDLSNPSPSISSIENAEVSIN